MFSDPCIMVLFMVCFLFLFFFWLKNLFMIAKSTNHYKFTNYALEFGMFIKKINNYWVLVVIENTSYN